MINLERYQRQLALPEISMAQQLALKETHIAFIGAGGLGAAALPYLAASGIGEITLIDHDEISLANLHRQTTYKTSELGHRKAEALAVYLKALNPECKITAHTKKVQTFKNWDDVTLLIDGSDNFETKSFLNDISIIHKIPLITASVNQWTGQCGIFAGYLHNGPCYHCLFPELPTDARNCNEAGILGTSAGLAGLYEAHIAILYLLGLKEIGTFLSLDFKSLRTQKLTLEKNPNCTACKNGTEKTSKKEDDAMIELISLQELQCREHLIVDVRTSGEIEADPVKNALHMELTTIPARHTELPKDKLLAFVCAGNIRSAQAAEYLAAMGYANICVLDKFSI